MRALRTWTRLPAASVLVALLLAPAWSSPITRQIRLETADKLDIVATFYPVTESGGPAVVLLPMFKGSAHDWESLVAPMRNRGIAVLAIDPRGHGRSAMQGRKDLGKRVARRDKVLFAAMHKDTIAGVKWLGTEGGCDPKKIVLIGAGVGFSVAIDTAGRYPDEVAAVAGLTPQAKTLGLDTLSALKKVPETTPLLLLVHGDEADQGAKAIAEARPTARLVVYDDPPPADIGEERAWASGTQMLERLPIVDLTLASWAAATTGSKQEDVVLDGIVASEGPNADPWDKAQEVGVPDRPGSVRAFRVGRRLLFGGTVPPSVTGLQFEVQTGPKSSSAEDVAIGPPQVVGVDLTKGSVAWTWGGMGSVPSLPGMDSSNTFGKTLPRLRAVHSEAGTTFEGEWIIPRFGKDCEAIRLSVATSSEPPPAPKGGMVTSNTQYAVDLPPR